jgi:hypothetical protein
MTFADVCHDEAHQIIKYAKWYEIENDDRFPTEDIINALTALFHLMFRGDRLGLKGIDKAIPSERHLKDMALWWAVKQLEEAEFRLDELPSIAEPMEM